MEKIERVKKTYWLFWLIGKIRDELDYIFSTQRIDNLIFWFQCRFQKQYQFHILYSDLKPGYHGADEVFASAIAKRFLRVYPNALKIEGAPKKELDAARKWFNEEKPKMQHEIELLETAFSWYVARKEKDCASDISSLAKKIMNLEQKLYDKDTTHLVSVMKHRTYLDD